MENKSVFETLNAINVNEHTEKKNGLTYLSWAWAWQVVKQNYPNAFYTVYENADGWNYFTDGKTCWVKTGVTIEDLEHIEYLPVMDYRNKSIPTESVTSFDVNKAIQRSLTKACARHGLGLYIYAGEDLPDGEEQQPNIIKNATPQQVESLRLVSNEQVNGLIDYFGELGIDVALICEKFNVETLYKLNQGQIKEIKKMIKNGESFT